MTTNLSSARPLYFLKLGGSLITDKTIPFTPRSSILKRLAREIVSAMKQRPNLRLILGHGSGSFGHVPARRYGTRDGVHTPEGWRGFVEVWREATALNQLVMEVLSQAGLPALAFPVSAAALTNDGIVQTWDLSPLASALKVHLLPVVYGDVTFDIARGGTILSTEDIFAYLAEHFKPERILLAGLEEGVWSDFPTCKALIEEITPTSFADTQSALGGSAATDVTGGMLSKVQQSLTLVQMVPGLDVFIFTGETPGAVEEALLGTKMGTRISNASTLDTPQNLS